MSIWRTFHAHSMALDNLILNSFMPRQCMDLLYFIQSMACQQTVVLFLRFFFFKYHYKLFCGIGQIMGKFLILIILGTQKIDLAVCAFQLVSYILGNAHFILANLTFYLQHKWSLQQPIPVSFLHFVFIQINKNLDVLKLLSCLRISKINMEEILGGYLM